VYLWVGVLSAWPPSMGALKPGGHLIKHPVDFTVNVGSRAGTRRIRGSDACTLGGGKGRTIKIDCGADVMAWLAQKRVVVDEQLKVSINLLE
jgi:hypothetical protein